MTSRALVSLTVTLCGLWLSTTSAAAQSFTPIFEKRYVRPAGTPLAAADTFAACDTAGSFRLVLVNGPGAQAEIATDPLSSGSVSVNGIEVVRESDLNQQITRLERVLTNVGSNNRIDVAIRSGPAGAIQVTVEGTQACGLRISSPLAGSALREGPVTVRGTLPRSPGVEVGVTVNGQPAFVEGTQFAIDLYLQPGVTALTAEVNTFSGTQARETIPISVTPAGESPFLLMTNRSGGAAPFAAEFRLSWSTPINTVTLDADGNGTIDFQGAALERVPFTYTRPGMYVPIARVTDKAGAVHVVSTVVHVMDPAARDQSLQAVWTAFKDALRAGDLVGAARYLHSRTRASYAAQLTHLSSATLASIDQHMTAIRLVELGFGGAEYEMLRAVDGQTRSFAVWFNLDLDGLWRLRRF